MSAHDQALMQACSLGNLELNQFLPLIADSLLSSLELARNACRIFAERCVAGIGAPTGALPAACTMRATATRDGAGRRRSATRRREEVARQRADEANQSIRQIVRRATNLLSAEQFDSASICAGTRHATGLSRRSLGTREGYDRE